MKVANIVRLSTAAIGLVLADLPLGTATAQVADSASPLANPVAVPSDPVDRLSMHLRTLAVAPRSLSALLGAGEAAIAVGDPNAALGFFARADQVDPRSGRAKAGLASALVMLERPDDALRLFGQATALGVPEVEIAGNRGLAYDLRGDARRAQRDYALAIKRAPDDETTRRYALSLGISGDRAQALALLDPLLRRQDQSAWRARAFILAMTGDVTGATSIARQVMPGNLAQTMTPFLARLPQLNAAERAHAVNFGTMPSNGQSLAAVEIGDPFHAAGDGTSYPGDALIPAGDPFGPRPADVQIARVAQPLSNEPRRIPGFVASAPTMPISGPKPGFTTAVQSAPTAAPVSPNARVGARIGVRLAPVPAALVALSGNERVVLTGRTPLPPPDPPTVIFGPVHTTAQVPAALVAAAPPQPSAAFETSASGKLPELAVAPPKIPIDAPAHMVAAPLVVPAPVPAAPATLASVAVPGSRLASILAGIEPEPESVAVALPTAAEARAAKRVAARKAADAAAAEGALNAAKAAKLAEAEAARRNPARLWVQIATGNNARGLPTTWSRIRDANSEILKGRIAWSAPFKATNRLLVGPAKSAADARAMVNALAKGGVSATIFTSEAGQEVERVGGK